MRALMILVATFLVCYSCIRGQTISLTFTATFNGNHLPLDSIHITNLTQGGNMALYGNDTVLVLDHGTGTDGGMTNQPGQLFLYPVTPNPVKQTANIRLFLSQESMVTLMAHDLPGREIASARQWLTAGYHTFTFTPGRKACYLLSVEASGQQQVQKLVSLAGTGGNALIAYSGTREGWNFMKLSMAGFPWTPGDIYRFIGYTINGTDTMNVLPEHSTLYTFQYYSGTCPPLITDINGNVYGSVQIGNQCWMKENLNVRNYRNGVPIPYITSDLTWTSLTSGARCWFINDSAIYGNIYGSLYNWYAVDNSNGLCPAGWHVPTDLEWKILEMYLGMTQAQADSTNLRGTYEGGKLKETGTLHWLHPNVGALNSSGFTAIPGGLRNQAYGSFNFHGNLGLFWSSSDTSIADAKYRYLHYNSSGVGRGVDCPKQYGYSVRCVRD